VIDALLQTIALAKTVFIPTKIITNKIAFASQLKQLTNCLTELCGKETGPTKRRIGIRA
jgi:hypothetical protein